METIERIWAASTILPNGCIICSLGNGVYSIAGKQGSAPIYSHRESFISAFGCIPKGYEVHHDCRTKRCINPTHLRALTTVDHAREHAKEARAATVCARGHSMERAIIIKRPNGFERRCWTCNKARSQKVQAKKMAAKRAYRLAHPLPPKLFCKRGHPWTPENVTTRPNSKHSYCKPCATLLMRQKVR